MYALLAPSPALAPSLLHPPPPLPAARTLFPQLPRAPRGGGGARCQFSDDDEEEAYLSELEASLRRASSSSSPRRRIPTGISSASAILSVTSLVVGATLGTFVAPGAGTAIGAAAGAFVVPAGALTGFARDPDGRGRPPPRSGSRRSRKDNQLASLPLRITRAVDGALDEPGNAFLFQTLALLFGFYVAGFLAMGPVGQGNYYETVAALPTALVVEAISRAYYSRAAAARTKTLRVLNSFKNGFMYGIVIDCLKVGG